MLITGNMNQINPDVKSLQEPVIPNFYSNRHNKTMKT